MTQKIVTVLLQIEGMTCVSCETRIENALRKTAGIQTVKADYSNSDVSITYYANLIDQSSIEKVIESLDYQVKKPVDPEARVSRQGDASPEIVLKLKKTSITQVLGIVFLLVALYMIINHFGGLAIFSAFPLAEQGMGYGLLFVIGLLTSIHCVAMCGGINISQCVPKQTVPATGSSKRANLRPSILYNTGRVISYTVIGGIVGALGSVVSFSGWAKGLVVLVAGVFMVIMGLNMLNMFPWLRKLNLRMPRVFAKLINNEKQGNSKSPLYIGLLNGLMPCGPLQAMQLYALSTGSPVKGALSMLLFSLGTVPLMFGIGALSSVLSKRFTKKMITVSAALVIFLGILMFQNGMSLSGLALPSLSSIRLNSGNSGQIQAQVEPTVEEGVQIITTNLSSGSYEPITVIAGIPVKWTINAAEGTVNGCNNKLIIPAYDLEKKLVVGENVIEFTPEETGTIPYSCWMGMIRSEITVIEESASYPSNTSESKSDEIEKTIPSDPTLETGDLDTVSAGCCGV
jgi:sulfite exporter TauE/SafE/copper chaperone CopZ